MRSIDIKPILNDKDTSIELEGMEAFGKKFVINVQNGSASMIYEKK
jgi:hypothetical protein